MDFFWECCVREKLRRTIFCMLTLPDSLLIATGNAHKVDEIRAVLAPLLEAQGVKLLSLRDLPGGLELREPAEIGSTFEENAAIKAREYAAQTGMGCLADDSGLEIDALDGRPGVISSHYCTDGVEVGMSRAERDEANNQRVLREMVGVVGRGARFVCVLALSLPQRNIISVRGVCEGTIGTPPQVPTGGNGFGYDPLFVPTGADVTLAEFTPQEKNRISHRGAALRLLYERLKQG